ncbi:MAG: xanthine dehydrogenase family protein subunit M [Deltaproteobacteria bacterium]|nr:xanthine dehydrogenase family protein subunit M [Deltaproteobacteria bacterium]MBW1873713.1 xanthine dehydrogenase family protein subunit M [Deltaproteobacteria bacterium]
MSGYDYHRPLSLAEVFELRRVSPEAELIAGGTDMMVRVKNHVSSPADLISLRNIENLSGIEPGDVTRIGALTTISNLIEHAELAEKFPVLVEAASQLGSPQIRNVATLGGNLCNCSPCADTATPLLVHEASLRLQSPDQTREVPLQEFFVGPGQTCAAPEEILTDILLPSPKPNARTVFMKKGRVKMDLAIASLSVLLEMDNDTCTKARLAAGSVAPVALRLFEVEQFLEGKQLNRSLAALAGKQAAKIISPISDIRASQEYRRQIIEVFVKRSIEKLIGIKPS